MKARLLCLLIALCIIMPLGDAVLAQTAPSRNDGAIPLAGSPRHRVLHGPPSKEDRSAAAFKMMLTVAVSLIVVFVLLRFYVRPRLSEDEKQPQGKYRRPGQDAIDRIQQALSDRHQPRGEETDADDPDRPA